MPVLQLLSTPLILCTELLSVYLIVESFSFDVLNSAEKAAVMQEMMRFT